MKCEICENKFDKHNQQGGYVDKIWYCDFCINNQPERRKQEDSNEAEFGCNFPVNFITSQGIKTILPGKVYDTNLNEI